MSGRNRKRKRGRNNNKKNNLDNPRPSKSNTNTKKIDDLELGIENLVFEDEFEDEFIQEFHVKDGIVEQGEDLPQSTGSKQVYLHNHKVNEKTEKLEYENSAYDMIHSLNVEYPCLSFDFLTDLLGQQRKKYPMTAYLVAGSQSGVQRRSKSKRKNKILAMKMHSLYKTKYDDNDSDDEELHSDSDSENVDEDPELHHNALTISAATNRIRSMPQKPELICVQVDTKPFSRIYLIGDHIAALDNKRRTKKLETPFPLCENRISKAEGFGLAFNYIKAGVLLTGNTSGEIRKWEYNRGTWKIFEEAYKHNASVEDLVWSPSESDVFASCSCDKTVKLWDTRKGSTATSTIEAHSSDVNVISWNSNVPFLIASGGDDGLFNLWDIRKQDKPRMSFDYHKKPITSIEWNPNSQSVIACSSEDHSISIFDLSLVEKEPTPMNEDDTTNKTVPSQLLFVHQGQKHIKEIHWHRQIPNVLASTAATGFNIFKPSNLD